MAVCPGGVFVVFGLVFEAAVEDADEAVGEGTEGLVVSGAACSLLVVEHSGSGAGGDRGERPFDRGVGESVVFDPSRFDDSGFA